MDQGILSLDSSYGTHIEVVKDLLMTWHLIYGVYLMIFNLLSWDPLRQPWSMDDLEPHVPPGEFLLYIHWSWLSILEFEPLWSISLVRSTISAICYHDEDLRTPCTCFHAILLKMSTWGIGLQMYSCIWMRLPSTLFHEDVHFIWASIWSCTSTSTLGSYTHATWTHSASLSMWRPCLLATSVDKVGYFHIYPWIDWRRLFIASLLRSFRFMHAYIIRGTRL